MFKQCKRFVKIAIVLQCYKTYYFKINDMSNSEIEIKNEKFQIHILYNIKKFYNLSINNKGIL
jgi:hypothetical protein